MGLLGSIWVKLGLRADDFKRGLQQCKTDLATFGEGLKKMKAVAAAVWLAVGAGVVKVAKEFINQTQTVGDKWGIFTAELTAGWGMFIAGISSGQGWNELIGNISRAVTAAKDAQMALDELFERKNSYSIEAARTSTEIATLQTIMRDSSRSREERMAAARKIMDLEKNLGKVKKDIAQQEYDAAALNFKARTGMNDQEITFLVEQYNKNRAIIQQAEEYNKARQQAAEIEKAFNKDRSGVIKWEDVQKARAELDALSASVGKNVIAVAGMLDKYNTANDALVAPLVKARVEVENVDGEVTRASIRANTMLGSLTNSMEAAAEAANNEALSHKGIINQLNEEIAVKTKLRDQATDRTELMRLNEEIVALQKKVELLKQYTSTQAMQLPSVEAPSQKGTVFSLKSNGIEETTSKVQSFTDAVNTNSAAVDEWGRSLAVTMGDLYNALVNSGAAAFEILGEAMATGNFDTDAMVKALLTPLADLAVTAGGIIMTAGFGIEALQKSLFGFVGTPAIIAGAALIAIGSLAKGALSSLGTSAGTSESSSNSYSGGYGTNYINGGYNKEIEFRVKGQDLVAVMNAYNNQKYR